MADMGFGSMFSPFRSGPAPMGVQDEGPAPMIQPPKPKKPVTGQAGVQPTGAPDTGGIHHSFDIMNDHHVGMMEGAKRRFMSLFGLSDPSQTMSGPGAAFSAGGLPAKVASGVGSYLS